MENTLIRNRDNNYGFLPTSAKEMKNLGWDYLDVILFTGDAYVDHPSFGVAVIARHLEAAGYRVGVVAQPSWHGDLRDFKKLGIPRLFFGVTSGNMDSMVNHYTAAKRLRSDDAYTPASRAGMRPDNATICYCKILKELYPTTPIVIGGIEASLRRLAHYDYWQDKLRPSILVESGADLLVYGMGDKAICTVARNIERGFNINYLRKLDQVAFIADKSYVETLSTDDTIFMNSYEECEKSKKIFGRNFVKIEIESNKIKAKRLVEPTGDGYVVVNPPHPPLTSDDLDKTYSLPFTREPHQRYYGKGAIPAYEMIKFSVNIHRGCFGGCSFCTISAHQGKQISSRSEKSILEELETIAKRPDFKGNISDLGGPSANMWGMKGRDSAICEKCSRYSCIHPVVCKNLNNSHAPLLSLYEKAEKVKGIKKIFIGSGIRYDMFDKSTGKDYLCRVVEHHTSGRLKVAPEHTSDRVLKLMRKPSFDLFVGLNTQFEDICRTKSLRYELIPYFISSHPGCDRTDMLDLRKKMKGLHFDLHQVQDFTPTPMTLSSVMYYTGEDPYTEQKIFVERIMENKKAHKELFFSDNNRNDNSKTYDNGKAKDTYGKRNNRHS
ncbi:MAG: YgiQ family radical SAM protein [Rikenellaceae bacterium]